MIPRTRGDCPKERPCLHVTCRYHLVPLRRLLRLDDDLAADLLAWLRVSCALDVADAGPAPLRAVGAAMGVTGEAVRQLEVRALARFEQRMRAMELDLAPVRPAARDESEGAGTAKAARTTSERA